MRQVALRTALIWHDEVMADLVARTPTKITLGATKQATFVIPDLGLPKNFAIVRPGRRGYLLTLGEHMRGTVCIEGVQQDVASLVAAGGEGGFHATAIGGRDWGVIDLDASGAVKLFFQFVPVDDEPHVVPVKLLVGGIAGALLATAALAGLFLWQGESIGESALRGGGITALALLAGLATWKLVREESDSQASFAFSVLLHAALLAATYQLADLTDPYAWPGRRDFTGDYLLTRIVPTEPPSVAPQATVGTVSQAAQDSAPTGPAKPKRTATIGAEGAAGGKGEAERGRDPDGRDRPPPPREALLTEANTRSIEDVVHRSTESVLANFDKLKGERRAGGAGYGEGTGTGVGNDSGGVGSTRGSKGTGTGGGGSTEGDQVSKKGPIDTGKERAGGGQGGTGTRPKEVKLTLAGPGGDLNGYTEDEIKRTIKTREGIFRKCYQKELDRTPGLGGKLVVRFKIGPDGTVQSAAKAAGSTLSHDGVEQCVTNNVGKLKFAPKGVIANVTFPFVYSQGS